MPKRYKVRYFQTIGYEAEIEVNDKGKVTHGGPMLNNFVGRDLAEVALMLPNSKVTEIKDDAPEVKAEVIADAMD